MEYWLQCNVSPGQFTGEYAIEARDFQDRLFSLFAPEEFVDLDESYRDNGKGWLRVVQLAEEGGLVLVQLPRTPLENGSTVTVKNDQLMLRLTKELA